VPAYYCYSAGDDYAAVSYPGFDGLRLGTSEHARQTEPYIFHFPDGNASIARMLVRALVPESIPGHTMDDIVKARADYSRLDTSGSPVRIRLNSTVVNVSHRGPTQTANQIEIAYQRGGKLETVRAKNCVLASYNTIPYICPELPERQKQAPSYLVKAPLVSTHVVISNWTSFQKLGIHQIVSPGSYHCFTMLDFPVSLGDYHFSCNPEQPIVLLMLRTPSKPGLPAPFASSSDQCSAAQALTLPTTFTESR